MRGARDWVTTSGKLRIPDTEDAQRQLFEAISLSYWKWSPMCFVEMCTEHRPFIEDIDVLGSSSRSDSPPDNLLLETDFFKLRAKELRRFCPQIVSLELTLFTASGWHRDKECQKASFHAIWRNLVVTQSLARTLRSETVAAFERLSEEEPLKSLRHKLLELSPKNSWDMVFDITSVQGGSFRMPFCDKVTQGAREGREVLPVGVYMFEFSEPSAAGAGDVKQVLQFRPNDLSDVDWLIRGSVRRPHDPPPPLVNLAPSIALLPDCPVDAPRQVSHSSAPTLAQDVIETFEGRSRWMRPAAEFREELNRRCGDHHGADSTWEKLPSKPEEQRWQWKSKRKDLRGCVELQLPSGKIVVKGDERQKARLFVILERIARPWVVTNTKVREKSAGPQQDHCANVPAGRTSNILGKAWDIPRHPADAGEQGSVCDRFLVSLCSNTWLSELLGVVSCRKGRGQRPMTDVFPVGATADAERVGSIIILGKSMLLQTSTGLQLQLQGSGLGKRLLWHVHGSIPLEEDLWTIHHDRAGMRNCEDEVPADALGTSASRLPVTSGFSTIDPEEGVDSQDEPDPEDGAGAYLGPWRIVQRRRQRPQIHAPKLAELKDPAMPKPCQQKNFNRRAKRREAREAEAREMAMPLSSLPGPAPSRVPSPVTECREPANRASRWQRRTTQ